MFGVTVARESKPRHPSIRHALGGLEFEAQILLAIVGTIAEFRAVAIRQAGFSRRVVVLLDWADARQVPRDRPFEHVIAAGHADQRIHGDLCRRIVAGPEQVSESPP